MKRKYLVLVATVMVATFILTAFSSLTYAYPSNEYAADDFRDHPVKDVNGATIKKPIAQFKIARSRNGELLDDVISYAENDLYADIPTLECYVGDTISFEDLSYERNGSYIGMWDFQYFGKLGESTLIYNSQPLNGFEFQVWESGETSFFLNVRSALNPAYGYCDPWSENGNHQSIGHNRWFPSGMYWYFSSARIIVHPTQQAKVHVRYWNTLENQVFYEEEVVLKELFGANDTAETSIHITDYEGYRYEKWNVQLPDGSIQYEGNERDVGVSLASWLPEKTLNVEFTPYVDTEVKIRYWDSSANQILHEETKAGEKVVAEEESSIAFHIPEWLGYEYSGWNIQQLDGTIQDTGKERDVSIILNGYYPKKYLNIEYIPKDGTSPPTPTPGPDDGDSQEPTTPPDIPDIPQSGECDGVIKWAEVDSHQVRTGTDRHGRPTYRTCYHTFTYETTLTASADVTPETLKSGYGIDVTVNGNINTNLISNNGGCSNWGRNRTPDHNVSKPTKATIYLPWTTSNILGSQNNDIHMENYQPLKWRLPVNPISVLGERKIFTAVELAGTADVPQRHTFDIYISGGGVNGIEFCQKLTKTITINGSMYDDDGTSSGR